jgi:hypothetical protein
MKKILYILFSSCFLVACSSGGSDIPEPLCEEGGTEVQMD